MEKEMSVSEFAEKCIRYNTENNVILDIKNPEQCPVHIFAAHVNKACKATVSGIKNCELCGTPCCPVCYNHSPNLIQLSRVTGYIQSVSGFNNAKIQELKDRKRYNIS